ncbi:MAG: hypothetical protein WC887_03030 [Candidatus Paceibacterota bacterium]|jgi:hypothetical protein
MRVRAICATPRSLRRFSDEKVTVLKFGTEYLDKATELKGTLTHWILNMGGEVQYLFRPKGLDEEGQPIKQLFLCAERLDVQENDFETVEVPFDILGTICTDKASGFTGMAVQFIRHINGCFHIQVQPAGMLKGGPISNNDFDIRELTGDKIPVLTEKEKEEIPLSPSEHPRREMRSESSLLHR